jgi:hypothetical protein
MSIRPENFLGRPVVSNANPHAANPYAEREFQICPTRDRAEALSREHRIGLWTAALRAVKTRLTLNDNNLSGVVRVVACLCNHHFHFGGALLSLSHRRVLRLLFHLAR